MFCLLCLLRSLLQISDAAFKWNCKCRGAVGFLPQGRIYGGEANSSAPPHRQASAETSEPCTETKLHPEKNEPKKKKNQ